MLNTIEDFAKLSQIMELAKNRFYGHYRIDLCQKEEEFWISIAMGFDEDYCAEQLTIDQALEYLQDFE